MNKKIITYGIAVVIVAVVAVVILKKTGSKSTDVTLETANIGRATISNTVTATGTLQASITVAVGTQVSGKISKIYADFNDNVKKGQLLAVIDTENLLSTLESSKASLDLAQADYDYQQSLYERNKQLIEKNLIAQTDFDQTVYNYKSAQANLKSAQARYKSAKTDLEYAYIYSPIDGVVLERVVEEGETVAASYSTPELFTIANDLSQMEIEADVDEADIGQLKKGQRVEFTVDAFPDKTFNGEVTQIQLMPEESSNVVTYTVVIKAENPEKILMPGMTASVSFFVTEKKNILVVPNEAMEVNPTPDMVETYREKHPEISFQMHPENESGMQPYNRDKNNGIENPKNKQANGNERIAPPSTVENNQMQEPPQLPDNVKIVWVKKENVISPKMIETGETDEINYELIKGLNEGDEIVIAMTSTNPQQEGTGNKQAQSPFMPKPPGGNRKK